MRSPTGVLNTQSCDATLERNWKSHACLQGDFQEAIVMHYTDPVPAEDTGMPLMSQIRVIVVRKCSAGATLRVALPDVSIQDLAGNVLTKAVSVDSTCMEQPLRVLPRAAQYLNFLGACLVVLVATGAAVAGWQLWKTRRDGCCARGVATGGAGGSHRRPAFVSVALATLALLLQGVYILLCVCGCGPFLAYVLSSVDALCCASARPHGCALH